MKKISDRAGSNKTKHLLVENELKTFDLSYFRSKNYFGNDSKNYLVFEVLLQYINLDDDDDDDGDDDDDEGAPYNSILLCESKGVSKEIIKPPRSNTNILSPTVEDTATKKSKT